MSNEAELIEALRNRDSDAFAQVFNDHSDKIYRLAAGLLNDEMQADGVVQETFLTLINKIDSFEGRSKIGTWLYRVAYNECMMRIRKAKPQVNVSELVDESDFMPQCFVDWDTIPELVTSGDEAIEQMHIAVSKLNPTLQAVFILRDIEELSTRETAESLDISESAVKVRLHRARLELRELLAAYFTERTLK